MSRILYVLYGIVVYVIFFVTFLYAIAFVEDWTHVVGGHNLVPHMLDYGGTQSSTGVAFVIDALLLSLFAVQHSVMARRGFKQVWTKIIPKAIERSTFVLAASLALIVMFVFWRPMTSSAIWTVHDKTIGHALIGLSLVGWGIVLVATFLINHFELFGLQQVYQAAKGVDPAKPHFKAPGFYKLVRHPIYLGFIIAFWATPVMTIGHLLFAVATLGYMLVAIQLEERDLTHEFGDQYKNYKATVRGLVPVPKSKG